MQFNNKTTRNVAEAVAKILSGQTVSEELKGDQHKIDKNKNNKIDAHDFKILRGEKKTVKEESCEDEAKEEVKKHEKKHHGKDGDVSKHEKEMHKEEAGVSKKKEDKFHNKLDKLVHKTFGHSSDEKKMNEDVEQLDEYNAKDGRYVHKGSYGTAKGAEYGETDYDKENKMEKELNKKKPVRKGYGARQNFVRSYAKEETMVFSSLVESYKKNGLKAVAKMKKEEVEDLDEAEKMKGEDPCWDNYEMVGHKMKGGKKVPNCVPKNEEVDSETYKKEMQDQKDKFDGKKKGADIAKPAVQAVKIEEDVEISIDHINGVKMSTIEERTLTEPESKKKEEYVKGMKKSVAGFKERYGKDAKSVMYATATKMAKKD
jgi:hypothetical protein